MKTLGRQTFLVWRTRRFFNSFRRFGNSGLRKISLGRFFGRNFDSYRRGSFISGHSTWVVQFELVDLDVRLEGDIIKVVHQGAKARTVQTFKIFRGFGFWQWDVLEGIRSAVGSRGLCWRLGWWLNIFSGNALIFNNLNMRLHISLNITDSE